MTTITVRYWSRDGYRQTRRFKTLAGASRYARTWVGDNAEIGPDYAISWDGIGRVSVTGCPIEALFARAEA